MNRTLMIVAAALTLAACQPQATPSDASKAATSDAGKPAAPSVSTPATTAANVTPSSPDAPLPSLKQGSNEAGSAIGGTAGGNTTDPRPVGADKGAAVPNGPAEPTGGDGNPADRTKK